MIYVYGSLPLDRVDRGLAFSFLARPFENERNIRRTVAGFFGPAKPNERRYKE